MRASHPTKRGRDRLRRLSNFLVGMFWLSAVALVAGAPVAAAQVLVKAHDYRMAGDASRVRLVLNFDREPQPRWFLLRAPHRLVIDLPDTRMTIDPAGAGPRGLVDEGEGEIEGHGAGS